jgi:hypothetical protein
MLPGSYIVREVSSFVKSSLLWNSWVFFEIGFAHRIRETFRFKPLTSYDFVIVAMPLGLRIFMATISSKTQPFQKASTLWFSSTSRL